MLKKLLAFLIRDGQPAPSESKAEPESEAKKTTQSSAPQKTSPDSPPLSSVPASTLSTASTLSPDSAPLTPSTPPPHSSTHGEQPPPVTASKSSFFGEHYESLEPIWEATLGDKTTVLEAFAHFTSNATPPNRINSINDERGFVLLSQSPSEGDMVAGVLGTQQAGKEVLEARAFFPLLKGYPNPLIIHDTHTWASKLEGTIAAQLYPDGSSIDFFAPYYFLDQKEFEKAKQQEKPLTVELGAMAFSMGPAQTLGYSVDQGSLYETALEHFLGENPDKTQADFENPTVTTEGLRLLMPTQYTCEWAYRCPVEGVEQLLFYNMPFFKLTVPLVGVGETVMRIHLYVSQAELNGYVPSVGEDIEGVLWMSGSIVYGIGDEVKDGAGEE